MGSGYGQAVGRERRLRETRLQRSHAVIIDKVANVPQELHGHIIVLKVAKSHIKKTKTPEKHVFYHYRIYNQTNRSNN